MKRINKDTKTFKLFNALCEGEKITPTVTEYELGKPSREIVALGYMAKALGMAV